MKVDFAFLCDYAEVAGKIYALGVGFDTIYAPQVPAKHPHFTLVAQLRASSVEAGPKNVEVRLIDEDGQDVIPPIRHQIVIPKGTATESKGRLLLEFGNVEFRRHGSYSVRIVIEQLEMIDVPFRVTPPPPSGATA